jgi:hypothetical protein
MTAAVKYPPALKSLGGMLWSSRPSGLLGKADVTGEETGKCTLSATAVGVQASEERSAAITLGRAFTQQGLAATCKDLSYKGETRSRREGKGLAHESV